MMTWEENIGWGSGSTMQTAASAGLYRSTQSDKASLLRQLMAASTQEIRKQHTFDLSEFIGGQGPRGPAGPRGLPGLPGWRKDYFPTNKVVSTPYQPGPKINHIKDKGEEDLFWPFGVRWQELARVGIFADHSIEVSGWAQIVNDSAASREVSIWMEHRPYNAEPDLYRFFGGSDVAVGGIDTQTIDAGDTGFFRVSASFINVNAFRTLSLFGIFDIYDASLHAKENHFGISGKDVYYG